MLARPSVVQSYKHIILLSRVIVTVDGVWIGESIYWIFTSRKFK
jgi:hypothetical protein